MEVGLGKVNGRKDLGIDILGLRGIVYTGVVPINVEYACMGIPLASSLGKMCRERAGLLGALMRTLLR